MAKAGLRLVGGRTAKVGVVGRRPAGLARFQSPALEALHSRTQAASAAERGWAGLLGLGSGFLPARSAGLAVLLLFVAAAVAPSPSLASELVERPLAPLSGPRGDTLFATLKPADTGVVTENRYADPRMWAERYHELEVGAVGTGVAIGDYDGDGRPDIFVVSKTESCRLFRNLGGWKFEDVTDRAGVADRGDAAGVWKQGATFADINNDGLLDIYLCRFAAPNILYVNQGNGTFKDEASARGLAVVDASVMGGFSDYDRDGALDLHLLTNILDAASRPKGQPDYLFHNNGDGTFVDMTVRAGIQGDGQGHSSVWWDYDHDGWPDLYVANDFGPEDLLYHNNRDGTFTDVIGKALPHTPLSSMGADLGDINNDGFIDLLVADMATTTHEKDQRSMATNRMNSADPPEDLTTAPQFYRNALYLATGLDRCLEAAFLTGLAATDWTWSVRFEDLDNDGRLDLHVTNGMHRESHNTDLIQRMRVAANHAEKVRIEKASPVLAEANLAYRNLGDLKFAEVGGEWGLGETGVSYGAAFGDLDGDGDLDLVYTNYQQGVTLLRNDSDTGHRVIVALRGTASNYFGVGATVRIETEAGRQVRQLVLARGLLSSSEPVLHFGLGNDDRIHRLEIEWPSGLTQVLTDLAVDRHYTITEPDDAAVEARRAEPDGPGAAATTPATAQFREVSAERGLNLRARESSIDEQGQNPLLPMRQNRRGPALAVGDLNGDGNDDLLFGGTPQDPARVVSLLSGGTGRASISTPFVQDGPLNDGPSLVFDVDADGDNDVLKTWSGVALPAGAPGFQPRLYLNDGEGRLTAAPDGALPLFPVSVGALAAADFDRSGQLGVFVGARVLPGFYPFAPRSALWANRGGRFEDVTDQLAPGLREVGMVTSALWSDVDGDGWLDLLLALEWGPVRCFRNEQGRGFADWTERAGFAAAGTGWWTSLASADFNGDGQPDYVAGNLGLNTQYHADANHPALLFAGDFSGAGSAVLVEGHYEGDRIVPWRTLRDLGRAIPTIRRRFTKNDDYARATLEEIIGQDRLREAERFAATEFRSGVFLSQDDGTFRFEPLPRVAQVSPLQGMVAGDFDGDGRADIYAVQNSYSPIPLVARFDGGLSQLLRGDGHGAFEPVAPIESNLIVSRDAKALVALDFDRNGWPDFAVSRNGASMLVFQNRGAAGRHSFGVRLRGSAGNPTAVGARITVEYADGTSQTGEIQAGSGYFSQSAPEYFFGWLDTNPPRQIRVRWPTGGATEHGAPSQSGAQVLTATGG